MNGTILKKSTRAEGLLGLETGRSRGPTPDGRPWKNIWFYLLEFREEKDFRPLFDQIVSSKSVCISINSLYIKKIFWLHSRKFPGGGKVLYLTFLFGYTIGKGGVLSPAPL